ncbi:hypothetical protein B9Z19DRAFT_1083715 [Tuber borchii]|uniref:Uncharacterized protein n=1 Tax=Tuber borchii TaxID=42251 RepID=A0A2T6ZSY8_TUBBO|nr:hypothetical protein B9Z19DRAFT_1083715 [Tuber borchii]
MFHLEPPPSLCFLLTCILLPRRCYEILITPRQAERGQATGNAQEEGKAIIRRYQNFRRTFFGSVQYVKLVSEEPVSRYITLQWYCTCTSAPPACAHRAGR